MPGTMSKKIVMSLMFAVVGAALLISTMILPWWGFHSESESYDSSGELNYKSDSGGGVSVMNGFSYGGGGSSLYSGESKVSGLFMITSIFLIITLIFTLLVILTITLFGKGEIKKPTMPMILGVLAIIFCILAPLLFMAQLPGAFLADYEQDAKDNGEKYEAPKHDHITKSFFGNYDETKDDGSGKETEKSNWGGDIGWIFSFFAFIMILISVIMLIIDSRGSVPEKIPSPSSLPPPTYPQQEPPSSSYYQQPQPPQPPPPQQYNPPPPPQYRQSQPPNYPPQY